MVTPNYVPSAPVPGRTIIKIHRMQETADSTLLYYDIGIGPSLGYAFYQYQITGQWPLCWKIAKTSTAAIVRRCALDAIQASHPKIKDLCDAAGVSLAVDLDYADSSHTSIRICRSYSLSSYKIDPDDIRIDKNLSWAVGSSEYIRAQLMAANAGLPIILADHHEKQSPMVDWCAEHGIILLPSLMPTGDYRMPAGSIVADRKANLLEVYNDFAMPANRKKYENSAMIAAAHNIRLVYVIAVEPQDHVTDLVSLAAWSAHIPGQGKVANGANLSVQLQRYQESFPNTSFIFRDKMQLCEMIYKAVNSKCIP